MAMNCYADESASYRAAKILKITAREAEGCTHQEAELKVLRNMLLNVQF
jgi:hypothetical protein